MLLPRGSRLGSLPARDVTLAMALAFISVGGLVTGEVDERPLAITFPVAVVSSLALAVRCRAPLVAMAVVCAANLVQAAWANTSPGALMALVVVLVMAYSLGAELDETRAALGLAVMMATLFTAEWLDHGSDYPFIAVELGGAWLLGRAVDGWRTRATYAEQHQRDLARLAVAEERSRIARELHDVVAHSLSVIAVQSDAAEAALVKDPERAGPPLRAIRASAREALVDMRQMLHVLRDEQSADDRAPSRGLADLAQLVESTREAGVPLEAHVRVDARLPAGLGLAVYRIVQEGLTNVRKHAGPVPTTVEVEDVDRAVRVVVRNEPAATPARPSGEPGVGHGLLGVRERAHAAGGSFHAGPTGTGGFELVATLPLAGENA